MPTSVNRLFLAAVLFFTLFTGCQYNDGYPASSYVPATESVSPITITAPFSSGNDDGYGPSSGLITAGEWNDLDNWAFWQGLRQQPEYTKDLKKWKMKTTNRVSVRVGSPDNSPVRDAVVQLFFRRKLLYTAHTNQAGIAELFVDLFDDDQDTRIAPDLLSLKVDGIPFQGDLKLMEEGINYFTASANTSLSRTELAFIVDATGSMGDELNFLKEDLRSVIQRVKRANGTLDVATATVFYRDEGDAYLTRHSDFTEDVSATSNFIGQQSANGGGDFPEAVQAALRVAVNDLQWSALARTRIAFLLLDAPPHDQVADEYRGLVKAAAARGIRIVPITASGIDKATELLMRQTAIATNGSYVFITNDSGIGNDHIEATVGDYEVEFLDDLLVRLVGEFTE